MLEFVRSRAIRSLSFSRSSSSSALQQWRQAILGFNRAVSTSSEPNGSLDLKEIEKVLSDVKADDVKVIPVQGTCDWTDFMVVATGRSTWHVRNIAQALIYKVKQKQRGAEKLWLPSVEGHEGGKWIVIDSGKVIIHALEEKARAYYNLESLWTSEMSTKAPNEDLEKSLVKTRRKNNSKKPAQKTV